VEDCAFETDLISFVCPRRLRYCQLYYETCPRRVCNCRVVVVRASFAAAVGVDFYYYMASPSPLYSDMRSTYRSCLLSSVLLHALLSCLRLDYVRKELHDFYASPNIIIRVTKSREMRGAGHVARMRAMRNAHKILVGEHEGSRSRRRPRSRWKIILKQNLGKYVGKV
jgi:hypothetical protein